VRPDDKLTSTERRRAFCLKDFFSFTPGFSPVLDGALSRKPSQRFRYFDMRTA